MGIIYFDGMRVDTYRAGMTRYTTSPSEGWQVKALCRSDPDAYVYDTVNSLPVLQRAVKTCIRCPVRAECLESAQPDDLTWTIRGGQLPQVAQTVNPNGRGRPRETPIKRQTALELGKSPCVTCGGSDWRFSTTKGKVRRSCKSCENEKRLKRRTGFAGKTNQQKQEMLRLKIEYMTGVKCIHGHSEWTIYIGSGDIECFCVPCDRSKKARLRGKIGA